MRVRAALTRAEGWWFDVTRRVETEGYFAVLQVKFTASGESGHDYLPTRPSVVRTALARLPVQDLKEYTFVDLGAGKGRVLLVAAEYPFGKIGGSNSSANFTNRQSGIFPIIAMRDGAARMWNPSRRMLRSMSFLIQT